MRYKKGLIIQNISKLKNKEWYHQRFDGCPHLILLVSPAELMKEKRKMGCNFTSHLVIFSNDKVDWYIDQTDIRRVADAVIKKSLKNPDISRKLIKKWEPDEKRFYEECRRINGLELKNLSNEKLSSVYKQFIHLYFKAISNSSIIDGFALGTDKLVQEEITKFLGSIGLEKKQHKYFTILTAPTTQSFINEAEVSFLKVAQLVDSNKKLRGIFLKEKDVKKIILRLKKFKKIDGALKKHQRDYFWSRNNYVDDNVLDVPAFVKEIKSLIIGKVNIKKEIWRVSKIPVKNLSSKKTVISRIKPPQLIKNLVTISDNFTYWQDMRKKKTYWTTHYLSLLIKEIADRFGYSLHEAKYLVPPEVEDLFSNRCIVSASEAEKRIKGCMFYCTGNDYEMVSGQHVGRFIDLLFKKHTELINDFRGLPACRGKVRGCVKIVRSVKELGKIKKGDILVAVMTRPDYVVGMRKAAAIVTDEGGVTSHAAIVSREIGIPCVIGTKIATKVLKDGDFIDVNANHGVVTVIKRK